MVGVGFPWIGGVYRRLMEYFIAIIQRNFRISLLSEDIPLPPDPPPPLPLQPLRSFDTSFRIVTVSGAKERSKVADEIL